MKTQKKNGEQAKRAFTLIEMIGVLAVIAILAALLIPKIFEAINNARVNNAAVSYNSVKTALADHYAKHGSLLSSNGTTIVVGGPGATNFDQTLLTEGFMDKLFQVKIGDGHSQVEVNTALGTNVTATAANSAYDLDGSGAGQNDAAGGVVVEALIGGVTENDAKDLNDRLDGATLGSAIGTDDAKGRVKYATGASTTVRIYVTHR
ncbi:MAG TPA: type II secretion system protein [Verrucomicrobiae bacterium]|nr:type II secretion system protein [Verrucomicrobiae bacterium]